MTFKTYALIAFVALLGGLTTVSTTDAAPITFGDALRVITIKQGGTGTSTTPAYGKVLVGNGVDYDLVATSSLGITGGGGGSTSPGGSNGELQYNASGAFGGVATSTLTPSWPLSGSFVQVGSGGSLSWSGLSTTTSWTTNDLVQVASNGTIKSIATSSLNLTTSSFASANISQWTNNSNFITLSSLSASSPLTYNSGTGAFSWYGLATTSQPTSSNLLVSNGTNGVYGVATSTLSATSPLTGSFVQVGSGGSLGCQTASGSQAGCLASADWTTFNNKQTAITTSFPLSLSGGTLSWTGLATSSNITNGQVLYATGANSLTSVATSSIAVGSTLSVSSGSFGYQIGGSNVTFGLNLGSANTWTALQTFSYASTTGISGSYASSTSLFLGTGQGALYTGSAQKVAVVATSTATIGSSLSYSGTWGQFLGGAAGTLSLNLGNSNTWTTKQIFGAASTTQLSASGFFEAPSGTTLSLVASGQIGVNTSTASSSLQYYDGTAQRGVYDVTSVSFSYATSSPSGTTTVPIILGPRGQTFVSVACRSVGGTANIQLGSNTASTTMVTSTTGATPTVTTLSANNAFDAWKTAYIDIGTFSASSVTNVTCAYGRRYAY